MVHNVIIIRSDFKTVCLKSIRIFCISTTWSMSLLEVMVIIGPRLYMSKNLTRPGHLVSPPVCRGLWMSTVVLYFWCLSDSASVLLYFTLRSYLVDSYLLKNFLFKIYSNYNFIGFTPSPLVQLFCLFASFFNILQYFILLRISGKCACG